MKYKKLLITGSVLLTLLLLFYVYVRHAFLYNGLDRALPGLTTEDKYPDWEKWNGSEELRSRLEYDVESKQGLYFSKVYLMERANHYQVRFRIGYMIPFLHQDLFEVTKWVLEDSAGNSYTKNMVVYTEQIAGLNCINVTLVLSEEEFLTLSGKELNLIAICSKEGYDKADIENSYAHCKAKIIFP